MAIKVPIFFFHRVLPDKQVTQPIPLTVSLSQFRKQIKLIARWGYQTISPGVFIDYLKQDKLLKKKPCLITFDDGTTDNLDYAMPVCQEYAFQPIVFPVTGKLGEKVDFGPPATLMSSKQLQQWLKMGGYVGCHTMTHSDLSRLSPRELDYEIKESKTRLEDLLGIGINSFVYPRGRFNQQIIKLVKAAGFELAFSTKKGNIHNYSERYCLRRIKVGRGTQGLRLFYRTSFLYDLVHHRWGKK